MPTKKLTEIQAVMDADSPGSILGLQAASIAGAAGNIPLTSLSAIATVAGISPDGSKDIPVASLVTALSIVQSVAGVAGPNPSVAALQAALAVVLQVAGVSPTAGVISAAALRTALGLPFTVAGVAASGWAGDVALASLVTAMQAAMNQAIVADQDATVAYCNTNAGLFDGQIKRLTDAGGNRKPEVVYNLTDDCWYPRNGRQLIHETAPIDSIAAIVNQAINMWNGTPADSTPLTLKQNLLKLKKASPTLGLLWDGHVELQGAPTAITHVMAFGGVNLLNWTGTTSRRIDRRWGMRMMASATVKRANIKLDNNEYAPEGNLNSNVTTDNTVNVTTGDTTLSNMVNYTNASLAATLLHSNLYLTRGGNI